MSSYDDFKRRQENHKWADRFKDITVAILILSVIIFWIVGDAAVKPVFWYWIGAMVILMVGNVVLDLMANKKDRERS